MSARAPLAAAPLSELAERPVHVVVRDYPETLAVLRRHGADATEAGAEPLGVILDRGGEALAAALAAALEWRNA